MKLIVSILVSLFFCQMSVSQTMPTIGKLITFTKRNHGDFDTYARSIGFTFLNKETFDNETADENTEYQYSRDVVKGVKTYTETMTYKDFKHYKYSKIFLSTFRIDLNVYYSKQIKDNGFQSLDCPIEDESNEISFCFQTKSYIMRLVDAKMKVDGGEHNRYTIILAHR